MYVVYEDARFQDKEITSNQRLQMTTSTAFSNRKLLVYFLHLSTSFSTVAICCNTLLRRYEYFAIAIYILNFAHRNL